MNYQILKFVLGLAEEKAVSEKYGENFKKALAEFAIATKNLMKFFKKKSPSPAGFAARPQPPFRGVSLKK